VRRFGGGRASCHSARSLLIRTTCFVVMVNGRWSAFTQLSSNQWPLQELHNIASYSPIHAHIHTPTAESAPQGDSQLVWSSQGEASRSGTPRHSEEPGIELATFRLPASLYLLSHRLSSSHRHNRLLISVVARGNTVPHWVVHNQGSSSVVAEPLETAQSMCRKQKLQRGGA
jgi:hypothetical protein